MPLSCPFIFYAKIDSTSLEESIIAPSPRACADGNTFALIAVSFFKGKHKIQNFDSQIFVYCMEVGCS